MKRPCCYYTSGRYLPPVQYWKSFFELVLIGVIIIAEEKLMKIIWWKSILLALLWVSLGAGWQVIRNSVTGIDRGTFGALLIASAAYLFATTALLKPFNKPMIK